MDDVADLAGVSKKTVSEVINGVGQVSVSTRERVSAAIAELDYRPNPTARRLSAARADTITLALPHLGSGALAALAAAVIDAAESAGLGALCEPTGGSADHEREVIKAEVGVSDGVLLVPSSASINAERLLPVVVLGSRAVDAPVDQVVADQGRMVRIAADHLRSRGRSRLVLMDDGQAVSDLPDGFVGPGPHTLTRLSAGSPGADAAFAAVIAQLDGTPAGAFNALDGIIAVDDGLALGALHALRVAGWSVPRDASVVALGNGTEAAFATPSITAVEPDVHAMVDRALTWLLERISGDASPARRFDVPLSLIQRESSAR